MTMIIIFFDHKRIMYQQAVSPEIVVNGEGYVSLSKMSDNIYEKRGMN